MNLLEYQIVRKVDTHRTNTSSWPNLLTYKYSASHGQLTWKGQNSQNSWRTLSKTKRTFNNNFPQFRREENSSNIFRNTAKHSRHNTIKKHIQFFARVKRIFIIASAKFPSRDWSSYKRGRHKGLILQHSAEWLINSPRADSSPTSEGIRYVRADVWYAIISRLWPLPLWNAAW